MRTLKHPLRSLGAAAVVALFTISTANAQPLPLPRLEVGTEYAFGLPGGTEMRCQILEPPAGEWVKTQSKTTRKQVWINLGAVVYIIPPGQG